MPSLTFSESCCDGGEARSNDQSAQPCGCDPGAGWTCAQHRFGWIPFTPPGNLPAVVHVYNPPTIPEVEILPTSALDRKEYPIATGVLDYFPDAIAEVAHVSWIGNNQHNPGQPLHWAREKSTDHPDCLLRHFVERGKHDIDGARHTAKMVWRALAMLQLEIEAERSGSK